MPEITREDVEKLKADWVGDPIWDLEGTEGFEAYYDELKVFSDVKNAEWEAAQEERERKRMDEITRRAVELGCSPGVMQYIIAIEGRIHQLEQQVGALLEYSDDARRELATNPFYNRL